MILAYSLDGKLRIRAFKNGKTAVVELLCNGEWVWCAWRSVAIDIAWECFIAQCRHHSF